MNTALVPDYIRLARPLPGNYQTQLPRSMGEQAKVLRRSVDSAGHSLTFVVFSDGEKRVLVDRDIVEEQ